jgi:hypothetical protein
MYSPWKSNHSDKASVCLREGKQTMKQKRRLMQVLVDSIDLKIKQPVQMRMQYMYEDLKTRNQSSLRP